MADFDEDAFLDKYYPLLEKDEPDPGGWGYDKEDPRRGQMWQGQSGWRRQHGPAVTRWDLGKVLWAYNVLLPNGSRGKVGSGSGLGFRRPGPGDPLWIYGDLDISDNDVRFVDGKQPAPYEPEPSDGPSLDVDLFRDREFRRRIRDDRFAHSVNRMLRNRKFYKGDDPRAWSCTFGGAAQLVAGLRGLGESLLDFKLSDVEVGPYPDDEEGIESMLSAFMPPPEKAAAAKAQMIESIVKRLPSTMEGYGKKVKVKTRKDVMAVLQEWDRMAIESQTEKSKKREADHIASLEQRLRDFRRSKGDPTMAEIKAHLTRLGWRRATPSDTKREQ